MYAWFAFAIYVIGVPSLLLVVLYTHRAQIKTIMHLRAQAETDNPMQRSAIRHDIQDLTTRQIVKVHESKFLLAVSHLFEKYEGRAW